MHLQLKYYKFVINVPIYFWPRTEKKKNVLFVYFVSY